MPAPPQGGPEIDQLRQAVDLYQGDFLAGFYVRDAPLFEEWALAQQARLREMALEALQAVATFFVRRGDYENGIAYSRRLLALEPWQEEAHRQLMRLLARSGQRNAALAQYQTCRQVLAEALDVEPSPETTALYHRIRTAAKARRHNLPAQSTPFLGRQTELALIREHLSHPDCRLLTLVGPGGIGKTRLAMQAAAGKTDDFLHGVTFVPLAPLSAVEHLVPTIANILQLTFQAQPDPKTQLLNYLRERETLLVLDNFEQLLTPAERGEILLAEILTQAAEVKLLVTSRERLNLSGEWVLDISGLDFPQVRNSPEMAPEAYSAGQLFIETARRVQPNFLATQTNRQAIAHICRLVEGMPLGLELAAAWTRLLSCAEIAGEIERSLDFLAASGRDIPARHQSLRAVFEHSWRLLTEAERAVFQKLSVFQGGFRREAAEAVAGATLRDLAGLADKSFLRRSATGRYEIHELMRQFGVEHLGSSPGATKSIKESHCCYYAAWLQSKEWKLKSAKQQETLAEIEADIDNIRLAWDWAATRGKVVELGQAIGTLYYFYEIRSWFQEGKVALERAVAGLELIHSEADPDQREREVTLGRLLARLGGFYHRLVDYEKSRDVEQCSLLLLHRHDVNKELSFPYLILGNVAETLLEARHYWEESLTYAQDVEDLWGLACAFGNLSGVVWEMGDQETARIYWQKNFANAEALGDPWLMVFTCGVATHQAYEMKDYGLAKQQAQKGLEIARSIGHQLGMTFSLTHLGEACRELGSYQEAGLCFSEALQLALEMQLVDDVLEILTNIALLWTRTGERVRAVELLTLVLHQPVIAGYFVDDIKSLARSHLAELETQLPAEVIVQAKIRGQNRDLEAVIAEILGDMI